MAFDPRVGLIRVRRENGETMDFEFDALCDEDKEYVKSQVSGDQ